MQDINKLIDQFNKELKRDLQELKKDYDQSIKKMEEWKNENN